MKADEMAKITTKKNITKIHISVKSLALVFFIWMVVNVMRKFKLIIYSVLYKFIKSLRNPHIINKSYF